MATKKRHIILRIIGSLLLLVLICTGVAVGWLSANYKRIIMQRLPAIVAKGSDSVYHISLQDIKISFLAGNATITGLKLWPDKTQANALRMRKHRIPTTLSTVDVALLEIKGISWTGIITGHSLNCEQATVHGLKWLMEAHPHPEDSLFTSDKKGKSAITRITVAHGELPQPEVTYRYEGAKEHFSGTLKGGEGSLSRFVYDMDQDKDTSNFLYASSGSVKPDEFIFTKQGSRYTVKKPTIDFETGPQSVTLKNVHIDNMIDVDQQSKKVKEIYNLGFPEITIAQTNWNKLVNDGILSASKINATAPKIDIHYISANASPHGKMGSYPNQQLHEVGLKTNIRSVYLENGLFRYTEPNEKSQQEGIIELEHLDCHITNITNLDSMIRHNNNCALTIKAKYNHKSDVAGTINLTLGDAHGHFTLDGYLENLDAADITKQTQALALFEVTSLYMSRIELKQEGDESYVAGSLTMLYKDLKISFLKFKSNSRKNKRGPLSFIANTVLLYPQNPMPNKEVRKVTTTFARDTTKGFVSMIWENVLRGAKKTAIRSDAMINIVDGPETTKGEKPKKGFIKKIFGKKH